MPPVACLLYVSDAADADYCVDLGFLRPFATTPYLNMSFLFRPDAPCLWLLLAVSTLRFALLGLPTLACPPLTHLLSFS